LISHLFLPIRQVKPASKRERKIKPILGDVPAFLGQLINFCFNAEASGARFLAASWFNTTSEVDADIAATESRAARFSYVHADDLECSATVSFGHV
jgi:hypothetical protein